MPNGLFQCGKNVMDSAASKICLSPSMFSLRSTLKLIFVHEVDVCSSQRNNICKSIANYSELTDKMMMRLNFDIQGVPKFNSCQSYPQLTQKLDFVPSNKLWFTLYILGITCTHTHIVEYSGNIKYLYRFCLFHCLYTRSVWKYTFIKQQQICIRGVIKSLSLVSFSNI